MTPANLASYVRIKTKTNSSSFTDADMLVIANVFKDEIANKINEADEKSFGIVIENDLEVGKRKYQLDPDIMSKITYFEATFDGTNYEKLVEYDLNTIGITTDETAIKAYMVGKKPGYFIHGDEIYLLNDADIADVENGLRMWIIAFPGDIPSMGATTDMAEAPDELHTGFPRAFHELLARRIIIEYKSAQEKPIPLTENELKYDRDLDDTVQIFTGKNRDRVVVASVPNAGNDGQDY